MGDTRPGDIAEQFDLRTPHYEAAAKKIEASLGACLRDLVARHRIDRLGVRVKSRDSFMGKIKRKTYESPFTEIEDQVAARVIVLFLEDMQNVRQLLMKEFNAVEQTRHEPTGDWAFGYESLHLVCHIPMSAFTPEWKQLGAMPATFEVQVRTLLMHAWAEPQHDVGYKPTVEIPRAIKRKLAWIAASVWGADKMLQEVLDDVRELEAGGGEN